jgi:hypothetical protein
MENQLKNTETSIGKRVHDVTHRATQVFNEEIEEIIDKTIVSPEIEAVIIQSVERVILALGKRYWKPLVVVVAGLLLIQSLILSFILKGFLVVMK